MKFKTWSNLNPNFNVNFLEDSYDRAKWFSPKKLQFKRNKLTDFHRILKIRSCGKFKTKIITVRKTVKLWILSSVETLEAHKTESGMETNCYKYKTNTIEVLLEWFLTTHTAATTSRIIIFTLSMLQIKAFFLNGPQCLLPYFSKKK